MTPLPNPFQLRDDHCPSTGAYREPMKQLLSEFRTDHERSGLVLAEGCAPVEPGVGVEVGPYSLCTLAGL